MIDHGARGNPTAGDHRSAAPRRGLTRASGLLWSALVPIALASCSLPGWTAGGGPDPAGEAARGPDRPPPGGGGADRPVRRRHLLVNMPLSRPVWTVAHRLGAERAYIVYGQSVAPNGADHVDLAVLRRYLEKSIPPAATGFGVLNVENPILPRLRKPAGSAEFETAQNELLKALRLAQAMRPGIQWTYYDLPGIQYWLKVPGEKWPQTWLEAPEAVKERERRAATTARRLLRELDWLAPSIYDFYPDTQSATTAARDRAYVRANVELARMIAGDRPVIPYVMRRYHPNTDPEKPPAYGLIPPAEFQGHVSAAMDAGADGVVWWGADDFYVGLTERPPPTNHARNVKIRARWLALLRDEKPPGMSNQRYLDFRHEDTLRLLAEVVRGPISSR